MHHFHIDRYIDIDSPSTDLPPAQQQCPEQVRPRDDSYKYNVAGVDKVPAIIVTTIETILRTVAPQTVTATTYIDRRGEEEEGKQDDVDVPFPPDVNIVVSGGTITSITTIFTTTTTTTTIYATMVASGVPGSPNGQVDVGIVVSGNIPQSSPGPDAGQIQSTNIIHTQIASPPVILGTTSTAISNTPITSIATSHSPPTTTGRSKVPSSSRQHVSSRHTSSSALYKYRTTTTHTTTRSASSRPPLSTSIHSMSNSTISSIPMGNSTIYAVPPATIIYTERSTRTASFETADLAATSTLSSGFLITGAVTPGASATATSEGASNRIITSSMLVQAIGVGLFIIGGWILDAW
ncbi:hypothetical protein ABW21_db0203051 [Orbilia brochopaga]|nr:hypothetical protein ABW21_db0203051 [Drechslerella brochopaga]